MIAFIPLTKGQWAIVDLEDLPLLIGHSWFFSCGYAAGEPGGKRVQMHRYILKPPVGLYVDHKNGNGIDNRRQNLRLCTLQENQRNRQKQKDNTSGFKGVSWNTRDKVWRAAAKVKKRTVFFATFDCKFDAATAYNFAVHDLFGEFAVYNQVPQPWLKGDER